MSGIETSIFGTAQCPFAKWLRHWSLTPVFVGSSPTGAVIGETIMWKTWKSPYELFTDPEELKIAELIQQRRYQMLIHSCIYYKLDDNYISDQQWNEWAHELAELQNKYPNISKEVTLYEYFEDWDGSSGAFLPLDLPWVIQKAKALLHGKSSESQHIEKPKQTIKKKKLF